MQKKVNFDMEEMIPEWLDEYPEHKFAVYKTCFLSTKKNSHNLEISEDVLRACADTILGNFLVAKIDMADATTHLPDEIIYGYFPKEQEIEFEEVDESNEKIVKAWAYCVISKQYGQEFNEIFSIQNLRNTSVEMTVELPEGQDEGEVNSFDIFGLTCLGLTVKGSCPDAQMSMVRFSEEEAEGFFKNVEKMSTLEHFVRERRKNTAETKNADIDKFEENNNMIELDGKEEDAKLANEIEFAAVDIGDMWSKVYSMIREHDAWNYCIEGIYEEDNQKFAVLKDENGKLYRLDFSLTEEGVFGSDELIEVQKEFIETDKVVRFAEPENIEDYRELEEIDDKDEPEEVDDKEDETDDEDDVEKRMAEIESALEKANKDIEERDNIIMEKDAELEELRAFKKGIEEKEKAMSVDAVMAEVESYLSVEQAKSFREEGLACDIAEIDAWANKVKAVSFEATKGQKKETKLKDVWTFGAPIETKNEPKGVWDRIRNL